MSPSVSVYITAAGRSSRFGSDKAQALIDGKPLIAHISESLQELGPQFVIARPENEVTYQALGLQTLHDTFVDKGPMSGLHAALTHAKTKHILFVACDLYLPTPALAAPLVEAVAAGAPAAAYRAAVWEPMFSAWDVSVLPAVEEAIGNDELAVYRLLEDLGACALASEEALAGLQRIDTRQALARVRSST